MMPHETQRLNPPPGLSRSGTPTWEVAYLFPAQGEWAESEYLTLGGNWMVEFDDGHVEVLPMPTLAHQLIVDFLVEQLKSFLRRHDGGRVLFAPLPVRLWDHKYREPDVIYLSEERVKATADYPHGADLVMEVVSEGQANRERDLITKRAEYAEAGISEYWIIDPQEGTITVYTLADGAYQLHGEFAQGATAASVLLSGFEVPVADVLSAASGAHDSP